MFLRLTESLFRQESWCDYWDLRALGLRMYVYLCVCVCGGVCVFALGRSCVQVCVTESEIIETSAWGTTRNQLLYKVTSV